MIDQQTEGAAKLAPTCLAKPFVPTMTLDIHSNPRRAHFRSRLFLQGHHGEPLWHRASWCSESVSMLHLPQFGWCVRATNDTLVWETDKEMNE